MNKRLITFLSILSLFISTSRVPVNAIEGGDLALGKNVVQITTYKPNSVGICSGSVIAKNVILTAKHCLGITDILLTGIIIGKEVYSPGSDISDPKVEKAKVLDFVTTSGVSTDGPDGPGSQDIAFLIIDKSFPVPANLRIPTSSQIQAWKALSQNSKTYGYGINSSGIKSFLPKKIEQKLSSSKEINLKQLTLNHVTRDAYVCAGDSGGPTFIEENGFEYILGPMVGTNLSGCQRESLPGPATSVITSLLEFDSLLQEAKAKAQLIPATVNIQIVCFKGKTTKKISGTNPKCPTGYKKKL
jgi:secreted trypsin-like serine protease